MRMVPRLQVSFVDALRFDPRLSKIADLPEVRNRDEHVAPGRAAKHREYLLGVVDVLEDMETGDYVEGSGAHLLGGTIEVENRCLAFALGDPDAFGIDVQSRRPHAQGGGILEGVAAAAAVVEQGHPAEVRFMAGKQFQGDPFPVVFIKVVPVRRFIDLIGDVDRPVFGVLRFLP